MANLIKSLPFIGRNYKKILRKAKITTTDEFLELAVCRTSRQNLSNRLGISKRLISKWVNQVDLLRVKGIGPKYLKLLNKIKIDSLGKLSKQYPDDILQKINSLDQDYIKKIKRKPSKKLIKKWIEESRKTRKIVQNLSDDLDILGDDSRREVFLVYDMTLDLIGSKEWETLVNLGNEIKNKCFFEIIRLGKQINELRGRVGKQKESEITEVFEKWKNMKLFDLEKQVYYNFFLFFISDFLILIGRSGLSRERKDEYTLNKEAVQEKLKNIDSLMPLSYRFLKGPADKIKKQSLLDVIELMECADQINSILAKLIPHVKESGINKLFNRTYALYKKSMYEALCKFYLLYTVYRGETKLRNLMKSVSKKNWQRYTKRRLKFLIFPKEKDVMIIDQLSSYQLIKILYKRL